MKKALVICVFLLFLDVVFQPALANEISITQTSDNEDCGCQTVNRVDLLKVKFLLNRLEDITDVILLRFGHIPEVNEKCEEVLESINSGVLELFCAIILVITDLLDFIMDNFPNMFVTLITILYGILFALWSTFCN